MQPTLWFVVTNVECIVGTHVTKGFSRQDPNLLCAV